MQAENVTTTTTQIPQNDVYFPLGKGSKQPFTKWTTHFESQPIPDGYNVGMRCLRTVVIDTDNNLTTKLAMTMLPPTAMVKTRKGIHFYYAGTMTGKKNMHRVDVIGTGGYVVAPPSVVDGHKYEFITDCKKTQWDDSILKKAEIISAIAELADKIIENYVVGTRDKLIFGLSGTLYKAGVDIETTKTVVEYIATSTNDEELQSRLAVVDHTYKQPKVNVIGAKLLRELNISVPRLLWGNQQLPQLLASDGSQQEDTNSICLKEKKKTPIMFNDLVDYLSKKYDIKQDVWTEEILINGEPAKEQKHILKIFGDTQKDLHPYHSVRKEQILDAILYIACENQYDWLLEKLEECHKLFLTNIDNNRLDVFQAPRVMAEIINARNIDVDAKKLEFFFCQAVQRAYEPGCIAKVCLILKGGQTVGKSSFCRYMGFDRGHVSVSYINEHNERDEEKKIGSAWLVECEEGFALSRGDMMFLKGFLSKTEAKFVNKYERMVTCKKRRCCFIFTTNEDEFLKDNTGEDRFTVVEVTAPIDFDRFFFWRDIFIGYCVHKYKNKEFDSKVLWEELNEGKQDYKTIDDSHDVIVEILLGERPCDKDFIVVKDGIVYVNSVTLAEKLAVESRMGSVTQQQLLLSVKKCMEGLGFRKRKIMLNKERKARYFINVEDFYNKLLKGTDLTLDNVIARHINAQERLKSITSILNP